MRFSGVVERGWSGGGEGGGGRMGLGFAVGGIWKRVIQWIKGNVNSR